MPSARTTVTELATGLGMFGHGTVDEALAARPPEMVSVAPETWSLLQELRDGRAFDPEYDMAFANGSAFLTAEEGLRARRPVTVEWKGSQRAPGDEVAPVDLRVDHVYLVSCKYLSRILCNPSPSHLFDELLAGRHGRRSGDWYQDVAPAEHDALYQAARSSIGTAALPPSAGTLQRADREHLRHVLDGGWPVVAADAYAALVVTTATTSAARWRASLAGANDGEAMLWRLLRMGSAPYFVLGATGNRPLRLRIATPWDWRQQYRLVSLAVEPQPGGQARVGWQAEVRGIRTGRRLEVRGHVEVRWSHGRFGGFPEAKVYLDTPHEEVPGYVPLD